MQGNINVNSVHSPCLCLSTYPFPISTLSKIIIFILGAPRARVFFISHCNLLSRVDWHAGFMSFIALLTCNPIWFISQSLHTLMIPACVIGTPGRSRDTAGRSPRLQFKGYGAEGVVFRAPLDPLLHDESPPAFFFNSL